MLTEDLHLLSSFQFCQVFVDVCVCVCVRDLNISFIKTFLYFICHNVNLETVYTPLFLGGDGLFHYPSLYVGGFKTGSKNTRLISLVLHLNPIKHVWGLL